MTLHTTIKSQYHAALSMLLDAVESCPEGTWAGEQYVNTSWQIAYHTLYFAHLYLHQSEADFVPWEHHRRGHQRLGAQADPARAVRPYTVEEIRAYGSFCQGLVDAAVDRLDLAAPECGFPWYRMSKREHQFVSLRHIQHHTGQLADRVRQTANVGLRWIGGVSEP